MILLAVVLVTLTALVVTAARWWISNRILRLRRRHVVLVTLKSGHAFRGVLFDSDVTALVLRNAEALGPGTGPAPVAVDGEVIILGSEVEFIQRP